MSAIPLAYNVQSVRARWISAVVAVVGIAGTVAVFVAMLAMARGFKATLVSSGSPDNAMVRRAGSSSEMDSVVFLPQLRAIEDAAELSRDGAGALLSPEVVVVAAIPLRSTGTDANVQFRGVFPRALDVHRGVRVTEGRFFTPGLQEVVAGRNAAAPTPASTSGRGSPTEASSGPWSAASPRAAARSTPKYGAMPTS
jgi:putative ABC transport system permease protein